MEEEEEEGEKGYRDGDTQRGAQVEAVCVGGGACPPQRKTRIYLTLPLNVRSCCCRESMETTRITTIGHTWTGESLTTLSGSVICAG